MRTTTKLAVAALSIAALGALAAGTALASENNHHTVVHPPVFFNNCRTTVTHLVNRPDGGNHGTWANDTLTRTVVICGTPAPTPTPSHLQVAAPVPPKWNYHAEVTDNGDFLTILGAKAPGLIFPIYHHTIPGTMTGGFTADFTAGPNFACFNNTYGGDTYHGTAPTTTSNWVKGDWDGKCAVSDFNGSSINNDWTWTYKTCVEKWVDAATNGDGDLAADGNITDVSWERCRKVPSPHPTVTCSSSVKPSSSPSHSPSSSPSGSPSGHPSSSPSASVSPSHSVSASPTVSPTPHQSSPAVITLAGDTGTTPDRLPTTGGPWPWYLLGGSIVVIGFGVYLRFRRRRTN